VITSFDGRRHEKKRNVRRSVVLPRRKRTRMKSYARRNRISTIEKCRNVRPRSWKRPSGLASSMPTNLALKMDRLGNRASVSSDEAAAALANA
jgi:hypothetical protein